MQNLLSPENNILSL